MEEVLDDITLDDFEQITSYNVRGLVSSYIAFIDNDYGNIVNFFTGSTNINPTESFDILKFLISESKRIQDVISLNSNSLQEYRFWVLCEYLDDIYHQLETTSNFSRWSRSSATNSGYKGDVRSAYILKQGQTLEDLEKNVLSNTDPDAWVNTALDNALEEEGYDLDGGQLLKVVFKNNSSISLQSVVDNVDEPEKTYGIDVDQYISFVDNDLKKLTYKETLIQTIDILSQLIQGDDPSFSERGLKLKGALGGNIAAISFPSIFRSMANNFATDDSFKSLSVIDVTRKKDAVYIEFQVETKAGELITRSTQI